MPWFTTGRDDSSTGWHFDAVGLLAVIGEDIVTKQAQSITSSAWSLLPRLIPAPQGLLRAERPQRLPGVPNVVVRSIYGGTQIDELNYFADLIHRVGELKRNQFQVVTVTSTKSEEPVDPEPAQIREDTDGQTDQVKIEVESSTTSPLNLLAIGSCLASIGLLVWSLVIHDAIAALSVCVLSLTSSLGCGARMWRPVLVQRPVDTVGDIPPGHIAIRTRNGAIIIVICDEHVARQLYVGVDEAVYHVPQRAAKVMTGVATALLMIGVILLGNSGWTMQLAIGCTFILLNGVYWFVDSLDKNRFWLLDKTYDINEEPIRTNDSYTDCLWHAIQHTKDTRWISDSQASPQTKAWDEWLKLAADNRDDKNWDAWGEKQKLMKIYSTTGLANSGGTTANAPAKQATESSVVAA